MGVQWLKSSLFPCLGGMETIKRNGLVATLATRLEISVRCSWRCHALLDHLTAVDAGVALQAFCKTFESNSGFWVFDEVIDYTYRYL